MQMDNILWTEFTLPSIILSISGIILWLSGAFLDSTVKDHLLFMEYPNMHHFTETRFSSWCVTKHARNENLYDRVVNILMITGYWVVAVGFFLFFMPITMGWGLAVSVFMAFFTCLRIKTPSIRERTKKTLDTLRNSGMLKHLYENHHES